MLLKNAGNVLPLAKTDSKIFVAGKNADNIGNQCGGWTITWQGGVRRHHPGTTILQGIRAAVGPATTVTYNASGTGIDSTYRAAIAVVGETPYAEGAGRPARLAWAWTATDLQHHHDPAQRRRAGDRGAGLRPAAGHRRRSCRTGTRWSPRGCPAPRAHGVADVLFGDYAPTGKLPMTWMQSVSQQPINDGDGQTPLFAQGYGLTY